jgi:hypothetical protein
VNKSKEDDINRNFKLTILLNLKKISLALKSFGQQKIQVKEENFQKMERST